MRPVFYLDVYNEPMKSFQTQCQQLEDLKIKKRWEKRCLLAASQLEKIIRKDIEDSELVFSLRELRKINEKVLVICHGITRDIRIK